MSTLLYMAPPLLFLMLCLCSRYSLAHGVTEPSFVLVPTSSFEPEAECSISTTQGIMDTSNATVTVPLVHRHGPCAPSSHSTEQKPSFAETLRRNRARVEYLKSKASRSTLMSSHDDDEKVSVPTHLGSYLDSFEYVATVGIGTPAVPQVVVVDTGSDLSWVQCAPCNPGQCSTQKDPLFSPSRSSSYSSVPCSSGECKQLAADDYGGACINGDKCGFGIKYADGTSTTGVYSTETLTLAQGVVVKDFHFGCGHDKRAVPGKYDGLLGLGRLPESLAVKYGGSFSYCLPALNSRPGFLSLGARRNPSGFQFTPMGSIPTDPTFYMVTLTGIAVGGKRLDIQPQAFRGGMIVDSGSVITGLQSTAYQALRSAFRSAMAQYPLLPHGRLDTCYNFAGHKDVVVPKISLIFSGGATVDLNVPNGIMLDGCLAFAMSGPDDTPGSLGNVNQRTLEVLFDTSRRRVGFRANAC